VTLVIELDRLPLLAGAVALAAAGNQTRASATNRSFVEPMLRIEGGADRLAVEMVFDAQTSGGLLLSVPPESAEEAVRIANQLGAEAACIVGHVAEKQDVALVMQ
jgi:selenide,water dikinase